MAKTNWQMGDTVLPEDMNGIGREINSLAEELGDMSAVPTEAKSAAGAIGELFTSVSDGKAALAAAITDKGKPTAADATFEQMAQNILEIVLGSGTAQPVDVLAGETFSNDNGPGQVGTMPNRGAHNITPGVTGQAIPAGYHNGSGLVAAVANLLAANIKAGVTVGGVAGTFSADANAVAAQILAGVTAYVNGAKVTGTMVQRGVVAAAGQDVNGTTLRLRPPGGYYDGTASSLVTATDADFISSNIRAGVDIFGLVGNLQPGKKVATGTVVSTAAQSGWFAQDGGGVGMVEVQFSGHGFVVGSALIWLETWQGGITIFKPNKGVPTNSLIYDEGSYWSDIVAFRFPQYWGQISAVYLRTTSTRFINNGSTFRLPVYPSQAGVTFKYILVEE